MVLQIIPQHKEGVVSQIIPQHKGWGWEYGVTDHSTTQGVVSQIIPQHKGWGWGWCHRSFHNTRGGVGVWCHRSFHNTKGGGGGGGTVLYIIIQSMYSIHTHVHTVDICMQVI